MSKVSELQMFLQKLSQSPPPEAIDSTPDGKAKTVTISHIEMTLDELFLGLWETTNYVTSVVGNEVVGSLQLTVTHPVTSEKITRTGAAAIIIQVNKAPENLEPYERSRHALDIMSNKKANALDLGYPKLKAECLKNAAQSFGAIFGRDLNRKKRDVFQPVYLRALTPAVTEKMLEMAQKGLNPIPKMDMFWDITPEVKERIAELLTQKAITQ